MLRRETVSVYCKNPTERFNTPRGQKCSAFEMLEPVVYIVTIVFERLKSLIFLMCDKMNRISEGVQNLIGK